MADADTPEKRHSVLKGGVPWAGPALPDGGSAESRAANLNLYAMAGDAPAPGVGSGGNVTLWRRRARR